MIIAVYLSPENSVWGRDSVNFFAHLEHIIYTCPDVDDVIITGDINSRIGDSLDYIPGIDEVRPRIHIDTYKNLHGNSFIDFLLNTRMFICNGRITPQFDNFTFIEPSRGRSVVDYFVVSLETLQKCIEFKVLTAREVIDVNFYSNNIDTCNISIPDHSVLLLVFDVGNNMNTNDIVQQSDIVCNPALSMFNKCHPYFTRYDFSMANENMFDFDTNIDDILHKLCNLEPENIDIEELDKIYSDICSVYHKFLHNNFQSRNVYPKNTKLRHRKKKPFWNENLTILWGNLKKAETAYLGEGGNNRNHLRQLFYECQKTFDHAYRLAEREYKNKQIVHLDSISNKDPKEFWKFIKNLGPKRKNDIPLEIYRDDGSISYNLKEVLQKWQLEFETLYNPSANVLHSSTAFYTHICRELELLQNNESRFPNLNENISLGEVKKSLRAAKKNKAIGIDNIPNEIIKNEKSAILLQMLFNKLFISGTQPSLWNISIVKPIPKPSLVDPRIPLQYRGISLLSTVYKIFTSILNNRLIKCFEENQILADEQNGFRKSRACIDHIFSLTSIIRIRKHNKLSTYAAFIDFEKAFDRVDRNLLLYKLLQNGISKQIYNIIKNLYTNNQVTVNVNGYLTDLFNSNVGVKQGDSLSPSLFNLYINQLAEDLRMLPGIMIGSRKVNCLLYADDLVLLAESEINLQTLLTELERWCVKWQMSINISKSKIIHFRPPSTVKTDYYFHIGINQLEIVHEYKYLGIIVSEHLDYDVTANVLAKAGGRALSALYSKFQKLKGLNLKTYSKLYNTGVTPVLDYCAGVWGYRNFLKIDTVQNRAIRLFLGVHNFAPNLAIQGDMGWESSRLRRKIEMLRLWNRFINMPDDRLAKQIFLWDRTFRGRTWNKEVSEIFSQLNLEHNFITLSIVNIKEARKLINIQNKNEWKLQVQQVPKLRTYVRFKKEFYVEPYIYKVYNRKHRSAIAQFRTGILPLYIETGRYLSIPEEYRLCQFCNDNVIENEEHFLFNCTFYENLRSILFDNVTNKINNFDNMSSNEKFSVLMNEENVKDTAQFISNAYQKRRDSIYIS